MTKKTTNLVVYIYLFYYFCYVEKLERHISQLIAHHNCVIVPGLGAFLAHKIPASYNSEEQIFMPPHRTLGFNSQVTMNDALLVSHYMTSENITFEKATSVVESEVSALRKQLSTKDEVRFGELGTFSMNINGEIVFIPEANSIDDPENYGFAPLSIPLLSQCKEKPIVIPIKRREIGKYIAAVAAIILTFIFVTPVSDNAFKSEKQASITNFATSEQISMMQQLSTAPVRIESDAVVEISPVTFSNTENIAIAENIIEQPTAPLAIEEVKTEDAAKTMFYIIVASSPNADNAQLAIKELTAKKVADYNVVKCGKRHRIAINSYVSAGEAQEALPEIQQTFPDAWILEY